MGKVTIIYDNGEIMSAPATSLSLEKMQEMVGGYIERIPHFDEYEGERCVALCDEEGKIKGKTINIEATKLWYEQPRIKYLGGTRFMDQLVGAVVIIQGDELLRKL
jgi:Domain of unknown function (DUF3846)